jgi:hypothetical protein
VECPWQIRIANRTKENEAPNRSVPKEEHSAMAGDLGLVELRGDPHPALDVAQNLHYAGIERTMGLGQGLAEQKQNRNGEHDNCTTVGVLCGAFDLRNASCAGTSVASPGGAERWKKRFQKRNLSILLLPPASAFHLSDMLYMFRNETVQVGCQY